MIPRPTKGGSIVVLLLAGTVLGAGVLATRYPELRSAMTIVVGAAITFALLAPYVVPGVYDRPTTSIIGVLVASVGGYGILLDDTASVLMWLLLVGGIAMVAEDQYRRRRGSGSPEGHEAK
ncbi:hypothetical protein EA462_11855 [Natrarchaeobius halalkaliphilus]|uniref:Uncharacterized protein n=1 Tax=Natrarchaeobius halalkaliphilus TaxID=1679091 RepID=A0A3N6M6V8_9EURY|nr:hypothetical protein [Natrarchaeobius halalkaliphilus]RQG89066.1 hypothetical protein EA462_11855 [Natrarchaeobius halalkaliphilus]